MTYTSKNNGTFPFKFSNADPLATFPENKWIPGKPQDNLTKNTTYRLEWALAKTGTNAYTLDARIYNSAGTLLYDKTSLYDASDNLAMSTYPAGFFHLTDARMRELFCGTNGSNMTPVLRDEYSYWGAVMVRNDDWCGAY